MFVRVSIIGLSAGTTHTFTVYTEIDDVIMSGADVTARTLFSAGRLLPYFFWKLAFAEHDETARL